MFLSASSEVIGCITPHFSPHFPVLVVPLGAVAQALFGPKALSCRERARGGRTIASRKGANVKLKGPRRLTALKLAEMYGHYEIAWLLKRKTRRKLSDVRT